MRLGVRVLCRQVLWGMCGLVVVCASLGCEPEWPRTQTGATVAVGADGVARAAAADGTVDGVVTPQCRPAATGELVINEIVLRPGGLDLDNDGASNGRDELVEVISRASESIHLVGASLWWKGERRGGFLSNVCLPPRTAIVIVHTGGGDLKLPHGATAMLLDRSLRLSDSGGKLELRGVNGTSLDAVQVPAAVTPDSPAVWARSRDGDWQAALVSHNEVPGATRPMSVGRCANADSFPCCLDWLDGLIEKGALSE